MTASLWEVTTKEKTCFSKLRSDLSTKVCVIGGGLTGLSTALHLAEQGVDCTVLEAEQPGWGASGRSGGQIIPGLKYDPDELLRMFGEDAGGRLVDLVGGAAGLVFDLIRRFGIDCDAFDGGWVQPAVTQKSLELLRRRSRAWRDVGADVQDLDASGVARYVGSSCYVGGLIDHRGGMVQPLAYTRGMARAASDLGARVFGNSRVCDLKRDGAKWIARTDTATVRADTVVIGSNAYSDNLVPGLTKSFVPVVSFQCATGPLPPELAAEILPGRQPISDSRRLMRYYRKDGENRLVIGGRGSLKQPISSTETLGLQKSLYDIFPQVEGIPFRYHWGGYVAMTPDHLPRVHVPSPSLIMALGYNGRGMALATAMGPTLAKLAMGVDPNQSEFPVTLQKKIPLHPLHPFGVKAFTAWYRWLDARDATH